MPPRRFTDEQEAVIAQEYLDGESQRSLAKRYGVDRCCIKGVLRRQGTKTRRVSDLNRVYALGRPDAFSVIDSEEKAYWWGFIYADGHIYRNTLNVTLAQKDVEQLRKLKIFLRSDAPFRYIEQKYQYGHSTTIAVEFSDRQLGKDLRRLGINVGRKNFAAAIRFLPDELAHHWIRGFFDGDGSARKSQSLSFCGSQPLLVWVRGKIAMGAGTNPNLALSKHIKSDIYYLAISGRIQALNAADYIYRDATIWMERKRSVIDSWPQERERIKPPQCRPGYVIKRKRGVG